MPKINGELFYYEIVLKALKENCDQWISVPELASRIGVTPSKVYSSLHSIRSNGYNLLSSKQHGLLLLLKDNTDELVALRAEWQRQLSCKRISHSAVVLQLLQKNANSITKYEDIIKAFPKGTSRPTLRWHIRQLRRYHTIHVIDNVGYIYIGSGDKKS